MTSVTTGAPSTSSPRTKPAKTIDPVEPAFAWREVRLYEFVLGLTVGLWRYPVIAGIPGEVLMMLIVVGFGIFTRPRVSSPNLVWFGLVYVGAIANAALVSFNAGESWAQRAFRLLLLMAFAIMIAGGRLHWRSLVAGAIFGLAINAGAFYLHLTPNLYPPYLTGWLGDKNVSGLYYAAFGLLALSLVRRRWTQLCLVVGFFCLLWLTGSRTSLAAFVAALAWWLLRNRLGLFLRLVVFAGGAQFLVWFEAEFSQVGVFADREGTDLLRGTIHAAEAAKVALTPWYGQGLNTAWVSIRNYPHMWFHDSYAALFVEGGFPMLLIVLFLVCIVGLGLFSRRRRVSAGLRAAEGALIVVLVTAWQLGEVFFTSVAFLALGIAWYERFGVPNDDTQRLPG
ncbi:MULTISPECIES: ABC transporter permease [unclassified Microbacterium]|uniref:ABC transporter permease n=1 Tax=unclassified Microbacterium TaxID=2609290 RepID=UPI001AD2C791|nr:ABC transporter permease [Microbacterium sp.]MBN9157277.1 ABC transporter permease [Microbacterium sp.]MBS1896461.1 zinc ABC transporter permease [Actinomycetota bacterium]